MTKHSDIKGLKDINLEDDSLLGKDSNLVREEITIDEAVTWWTKHKLKVYAAFLVIFGALGGNVDRVNEIATDLGLFANEEIQERLTVVEEDLKSLKTRVDALDGSPPPSDDDGGPPDRIPIPD